MEQLLLFEESKQEKMERELIRLRDQCERIRKGQYAKLTNLDRMYKHLNDEVEFLKANICKS